MMKISLSIIIVTLFAACGSSADKTNNTGDSISTEILISERIDGPANVRAKVNGKLLFFLMDNVPVTSTVPEDQWCQVGVLIDVTPAQYKSLKLRKGDKIYVDKVKIGQAVETVQLQSAFANKDGYKGELVGYTSVSNIRQNTLPENVLSEIINNNSELPLTKFKKFLSDFEFSEGSILSASSSYQIDENWIDDPSPLMRIILLFEKDVLIGVIHSRKLNLRNFNTRTLQRGFTFSFPKNSPSNMIDSLATSFNIRIKQVD